MSNLKKTIQEYLNFVRSPHGDHRDFDYTLDELQQRVFEAAVEAEHGPDIWQNLVLMPL